MIAKLIEKGRELRARLANGLNHLRSVQAIIRSLSSRGWRRTLDAGLSLLKKASLRRATAWNQIYTLQYRLGVTWLRWANKIALAGLVIAIYVSYLFLPSLAKWLASYTGETTHLADLKTLFGNFATALIGADAIAFSLIMFAMQINVERLPHGLFRKISNDKMLMSAFLAMFGLAVAVGCVSLLIDSDFAPKAVLIVSWCFAMTIILLLFAYKRALSLINPVFQLNEIVASTVGDLKMWEKRAARAKPIYDEHFSSPQSDENPGSLDTSRIAFFNVNKHWTTTAEKALDHVFSFARRYAEQGDYEIANYAFKTVVKINAEYISIKGKTFVPSSPFVDVPLATDGFINDTLEHLRKDIRAAVARTDEEGIEQNLRTLADLVRIYLQIDYGTSASGKTHAKLASSYLAEGAQSLIPHAMPDVLMEAIRLLGATVPLYLSVRDSSQASPIADKIGLIGAACAANSKNRPVTLAAAQQLTNATAYLIASKTHDIRMAVKSIKQAINLIATLLLNTSDSPLVSNCSTYLSPYYSGTSPKCLESQFATVANAVLNAAADDTDAGVVLQHFDTWSERLHEDEQAILLLAVQKRSNFAIDHIYWISEICQILLAASTSPACGDRTRENIQRNVLRLIDIFSSIPNQEEVLAFVENAGVTNVLFDVACAAHDRDCTDVVDEMENRLFDWAFRIGPFTSLRHAFGEALSGLILLSLMRRGDSASLIASLRQRLGAANAPSADIRQRVARDLRETIRELRQMGDFVASSIDRRMGRFENRQLLADSLGAVAELLHPQS